MAVQDITVFACVILTIVLSPEQSIRAQERDSSCAVCPAPSTDTVPRIEDSSLASGIQVISAFTEPRHKTSARPAVPDAQYRTSLYLRNEYSGFWKKAGRAQIFIGGVEAVGMIALVAMPKEVTKWEEDWVQSISRNWKRTFTQPPVMDQDEAWINYIGHPVVGSWYYNSVRSQNAKWWQSFLWATAQSFFWEYVIEGMAEQPSIQDLWTTPVLGMALGEPIHQATLAMRKNGYTFMEKVFVTVLNPTFVVNNGYKTPLTYQKKNLARF